MPKPTTAAVIGLGAAGLVALKNLKEEGFEVTGFERNGYIGGLWKFSEDGQTSVLDTTVVNISKERGCFSDFPYPENVPSYCTGAQVHEYLLAYTKHFKLESHMQLNTPIQQITFNDEHEQWVIKIQDENDRYFDKVVIAIGGVVGLPNMPKIEGIEKFKGINIHSQAFKRPQDFAGKRVMVIGFGNSAADTATQLASTASKVYLAHRNGAHILPRGVNGQPLDHALSLRLFTIQTQILHYFPHRGERFFNNFLENLQNKTFTLRPEWGFSPPQKVPIVSDTLIPCLTAGSIISTKAPTRILSPTTALLSDGTTLDTDALIWCTGYKPSFSLLPPRFDPTSNPPSWTTTPGSNGKPTFRLYHNVFSTVKPDSLAFLGNVHFAAGGFMIFDMAAMAITQVWAGKSQLPTQAHMNRDVDAHLAWLADVAARGSNVSPAYVDGGAWTRAMDELGGTGVNEYLGYGWKGWWFWLRDMRFCNLLMGGIWSPHVYRVFEGKRKAWGDAREAIESVNRAVAKSKKKGKDKVV